MKASQTKKFVRIDKTDSQYNFWNDRGTNARFKGNPEYIDVVENTAELIESLQNAVDQNKYVVIRSGGHCLEQFVSNSNVNVVIDISHMKGVKYDHDKNSFEVCAGNTVGETYQILHEQWGVILPAGEHPNIGMGGHIAGGAFGFMCRQYGLAVDYMYAVELLHVDANKKIKTLVASREADDPNREVWWAHTGGGAGNFGVVTKYWFRAPDVTVSNPNNALPKAPLSIATIELEWEWENIDQQTFIRLVNNFQSWCAANADPELPTNVIFATLHLFSKHVKKIQLKGVRTMSEDTDRLTEEFIECIQKDVDIPCHVSLKKMSWLDFALNPFPDIFSGERGAFKVKDAFMRAPFDTVQLEHAYHCLTDDKISIPGGFIGLATYGGAVNKISPNATASIRRDAIMTTSCSVGWQEAGDEEKSLNWVRACYQSIFEDTGGVPVVNEQSAGSIINHPDADHADKRFNKSGVPWHELYYGSHYKRLQNVKAKTDPCNVFHHILSVGLL